MPGKFHAGEFRTDVYFRLVKAAIEQQTVT